MTQIAGGCLCGAVRYSTDVDPSSHETLEDRSYLSTRRRNKRSLSGAARNG